LRGSPDVTAYLAAIQQKEKALGLRVQDVDRLVAVMPQPDLPRQTPGTGGPGRGRTATVSSTGEPWLAIELKPGKTANQQAVRREILGENDQERSQGERKYFVSTRQGGGPFRALAFLNDQVFVLALREDGMKGVLGQKHQPRGPMRPAIKEAARNP